MIDIKNKKISILIFLFFLGCMEPNTEDLWSYRVHDVLQTNGFARDLSLRNDTVFIAAGQSGIQVWDLTSKTIINSFSGYYEGGTFLEFEDLSLIETNSKNDLIFISESNKDVKIFNYDDLDSISYRNTIMSAKTKEFKSFATTQDQFVMYTADNDDGLKWGIYNLDTTNIFGIEFIEWTPSGGAEVYTPGKSECIDSDGTSTIVMGVDQLGVELFSIDSLGASPVLIGRVDTEGNAIGVSMTEDGVYVACDNAGATYIPKESFSANGSSYRFAEDLTVNHISINGTTAILSLGSKGIAAFDISDPMNPIEKGVFPVGYVYKTIFWNENFLVCTREGLSIIEIQL
jgi:hypothetical protein